MKAGEVMFREMCISAVLVILFAIPGGLWAADDADKSPSVEEAMSKIAQLGPGQQAIKKDKKGRILSALFVGQAHISTVLGKARGLEIARNKADLAASAEFVKWLNKGAVTVYQSSDEERVILTEGTEGKEDGPPKESGKAVEKDSKRMESIVKGFTQGLQVVHNEVDGDGKTYTIVKGWKADTAEGLKKIAADVASDEPRSKESKGRSAKEERKGTSLSSGDKEIKSSKATSSDAKDFLP